MICWEEHWVGDEESVTQQRLHKLGVYLLVLDQSLTSCDWSDFFGPQFPYLPHGNNNVILTRLRVALKCKIINRFSFALKESKCIVLVT